jgi:hypothetical protein
MGMIDAKGTPGEWTSGAVDASPIMAGGLDAALIRVILPDDTSSSAASTRSSWAAAVFDRFDTFSMRVESDRADVAPARLVGNLPETIAPCRL